MDFEEIIPERYRINYNQKTGVWRILDTWHEQIKNISNFNIEIPDSSPAMKVISDLELNSLLAYLDKLGWLDKILEKKKEKEITLVGNAEFVNTEKTKAKPRKKKALLEHPEVIL